MFNSEIEKDLRHNFIVSVLESSFFGLGTGFASFIIIIPLFVSGFTSSALLMGLIPAIPRLGWQLPQIFIADKIARLQYYKPTIMLLTINQKLPFLGLAIIALLQSQVNKETVLQITFILLIWQGLGSGFSATASQSMIAKIIPSEKLGIFYGTLAASANFMSIVGAMIASILLKQIAQPFNFALCFLCASFSMALSWIMMSKTREPVSKTTFAIKNRREFWGSLSTILRHDANFRCFVIARMISQLALMPLPFYTIYAIHKYAIGEEAIGLIASILMLTQTIAGLVLGWASDYWGNKLVLQTGSIACTLGAFLACIAPNVSWFYVVFIAMGIGMVALQNVAAVMSLEFGNHCQRPAYIGLSNTLVAPATIFTSLLGGYIADNFGYTSTFLVAAIGGLATALCLHMGVHNPHHFEYNFSNEA